MKRTSLLLLAAAVLLTACEMNRSLEPIPPSKTTVIGQNATISLARSDCCINITFTGPEGYSSRWFITILNESRITEPTDRDLTAGATYTVGDQQLVCFDGDIDIEVTIYGPDGSPEVLEFSSECSLSS